MELELELELLDVGGGGGGGVMPLLELGCDVTTPPRTVEVDAAEDEDVLGGDDRAMVLPSARLANRPRSCPDD